MYYMSHGLTALGTSQIIKPRAPRRSIPLIISVLLNLARIYQVHMITLVC